MTAFVAALPMYDWPENRAETDAEWVRLRAAFHAAGINAPQNLIRKNSDLPPVPGGIRSGSGEVIAPDPASLPPDELHFPSLWLHPNLLFAQTCWGPMELGLSKHVRVIGQPSYDSFEGGRQEFYSSAIVMRQGEGTPVPAPDDGLASIPLNLLRGKRLGYNSDDSMSGLIGLTRDLDAIGESLDIFSERLETGGHRASIIAIAQGRADVCAIDCRSWDLAHRFEPEAQHVQVVGWTAHRKGLPYITSLTAPVIPLSGNIIEL